METTEEQGTARGDGGAWRKPLVAAAWPAVGALIYTLYACFPQWFPAGTGSALVLLLVAEGLAMAIASVRAKALADPSPRNRRKVIWLIVSILALLALLHFGFEVEWAVMVPMLAWITIAWLAPRWSGNEDAELARQQTQAVLQDRGTVLEAILALTVLGTPVLLGSTQIPESWLAFYGTVLLLQGAASNAFVHRPKFLRKRKRLLDHPWINALSRRKRIERKVAKLPQVAEESPADLEAHAQLSLTQRFKVLLSPATLKKWWRYTWIGTAWMWAISSGGAILSGKKADVWDDSGALAVVMNWAFSLLAIGFACLVVAAAGMLPIVVHSAVDRRRGAIGLGFLLGLMLSCVLLVVGFWALFQLRDLIAG